MRVALKHLAQDELRRFLQSWQLMYPHETNRLPIGLETTGPVVQEQQRGEGRLLASYCVGTEVKCCADQGL